MNTSLSKTMAVSLGLASLAVFSVVPAMAEADYPAPVAHSIESIKTSAEVRAEYQQAVKDGTLRNQSDSGETQMITSAAAPASTLTRDDVRADTIEWLRLHRGDVDMGSR